MNKFKLDKKLADDCFFIDNLQFSQLLLMNDSNYPWFILVPQKNNLSEFIDLNFEEQKLLLKEINLISKILKEDFDIDKINIASLGNVVKQLHVHIIGRKNNDISFPRPVWGSAQAKSYTKIEANKIIELIKTKLNEQRNSH